MARPMFASYEAQARYEAKECELGYDGERVMELVGQIADNDTYFGPVETKIQLIAAILQGKV